MGIIVVLFKWNNLVYFVENISRGKNVFFLIYIFEINKFFFEVVYFWVFYFLER